MKTYSGRRLPNGTEVKIVHNDGKVEDLPLHSELFNHSRGFEWGYSGSGPAQLALAILADALGNGPTACRLHQQFKFKYIATISRKAHWQITADEAVRRAAEISHLPLMRMPDGSIRHACADCVAYLRGAHMLVADKLGVYDFAPGVTFEDTQRAVRGRHKVEPDLSELGLVGPLEH